MSEAVGPKEQRNAPVVLRVPALGLVDEEALRRDSLLDVAELLDDGVLVAGLARKEAHDLARLYQPVSRIQEQGKT